MDRNNNYKKKTVRNFDRAPDQLTDQPTNRLTDGWTDVLTRKFHFYKRVFHSQGFEYQCCVFAWIRIKFSNFSGSGSGFSPQILEQERVQKGLLKLFIRKNLKIIAKGCQKMKKATISYQKSS